jgi:tRNA threonylcarbamoyladenosine biosynthesis protein TsaE
MIHLLTRQIGNVKLMPEKDLSNGSKIRNINMLEINSEQAMLNLGEYLGERAELGDLLFLFGELGTGKTTLTKGIAKGLEIREEITSPTFQLRKSYRGRCILNHLDLYRLQNKSELAIIAAEELLEEGVTVVEWGELLVELLAPAYLEISIAFKSGFSGRMVAFIPHGPKYDHYIRRITDVNFGN